MKTVVLFGLFFVGYTSASVPVETFYHENVGIPLAESIRAAETARFDSSVKSDDSDRIVGGVISPTNAHPYLAGLLITFINAAGTSACGSSLLSANRLVTAAHCWFDGRLQANQFVVVLGTNTLFFGGLRVATRQVFVHPQWFPTLLNNDVAMIYLPYNVPLGNTIRPIALPNTFDLNNQFVGQWAVAAGYGVTSDAQTGITVNQMMSQVNLQVITVQQCMAVFGSNFVRNTNICTNGAGGVGICRGDSGGPLWLNRNGVPTLIGVSSFVAQNRCQDGFPSAFARVTSYSIFIRQHL